MDTSLNIPGTHNLRQVGLSALATREMVSATNERGDLWVPFTLPRRRRYAELNTRAHLDGSAGRTRGR